MPAIGIGTGIGFGGGSWVNSLSSQYKTIYSSFTTKPSKAIAQAQDVMVRALVSEGIWAKLDWMAVFAVPYADNSLINWVSPGTRNPTLSASAPTFAANQGYTGGASKYIDSGYIPATHANHLSQNSACVGGYFRTGNKGAYHHFGVIGANDNRLDLLPYYTDNKMYWFANDATGGNIANTSADGFWALSRTGASTVDAYRNTIDVQTSTRASVGLPNTYSIYFLAVNNKGSSTNNSTDEISMGYISSGLSAAEVSTFTDIFEAYMDSLSKGVIPALVEIFDETKFIDGMVQSDETTYKTHTALSRFKFTTDATILKIKVRSTLYDATPSLYGYVVVYVDAVRTNYKFTDSNYKRIILAPGTKVIQIIEEGTSIPSGTTQLGTYITSVLTNGATNTIDYADPANRRTFLGDSISVGASATYMFDGWTTLFRQAGASMNNYGWGYNSIFDVASTAGKRTTTVSFINSLMDGSSSNTLIIALGTNDYGLPKCSAADFETYYADLLVAINAARPTITIKCLTPYDRGTETANSYGNTLDDYRTAISNAASGKGYASVVSGKSILTVPTDFNTDVLHPTTAGHSKLYTALSGSL